MNFLGTSAYQDQVNDCTLQRCKMFHITLLKAEISGVPVAVESLTVE